MKYKCAVCENDIELTDSNSMSINKVPSSTFKIASDSINLNIYICDFCGAVQLYDVPLSDNYAAVYRSIGTSENYRQQKKEQLKKFIDDYDLINKSILEVGCGDGQYLEVLKELGIKDLCGMEAGKSNYIYAINKGYTIINGKIGLNPIKHDCICCFHYLEHIPEPNIFIKNIYNGLNDGGIALFEVPNYDYIEQNNIWLEFTKDHRIYYGKRSLTYLLQKHGFKIELLKDNGIVLTVIVRKIKLDLLKFKNQINKDITKFNQLIKSLNNEFAIYGAGHYIQTLLNNTDVKPRYVYDSNKLKCGYYFNDVVIEYKDLIYDMKDCDNIIICCGMYNQDIYKMLTEMNLNKNLIIWEGYESN